MVLPIWRVRQCPLYRIFSPVASVTMACDFCENCDFCDFKFRTFSSFRSMRTLFLTTYFSVLSLLNSLNFTWLCVFSQPSFHSIYRYSKDLRLLHSILFRKVREQHSQELSEVLAYIPAFVCSLSRIVFGHLLVASCVVAREIVVESSCLMLL